MTNLKKLVKVEIFKGKRYIVARNPNGTFDQRRPYKGTQAIGNINHFREIYKNQRSLDENVTRTVVSGRQGTIQHTEFVTTGLDKRNTKPIAKPRGKASYFVSGEVIKKGKRITVGGTSLKKGTSSDTQTSAQCKERAWETFLANVGAVLRGNEHYDEDEGIRQIENGRVENIREGWVRYD